MSGWDSRLEKGPDGQKCRTCIYRAANRYGPWGCGYADVTGQSKLAAFPDAEPGTRAGRHCICKAVEERLHLRREQHPARLRDAVGRGEVSDGGAAGHRV